MPSEVADHTEKRKAEECEQICTRTKRLFSYCIHPYRPAVGGINKSWRDLIQQQFDHPTRVIPFRRLVKIWLENTRVNDDLLQTIQK